MFPLFLENFRDKFTVKNFIIYIILLLIIQKFYGRLLQFSNISENENVI